MARTFQAGFIGEGLEQITALIGTLFPIVWYPIGFHEVKTDQRYDFVVVGDLSRKEPRFVELLKMVAEYTPLVALKQAPASIQAAARFKIPTDDYYHAFDIVLKQIAGKHSNPALS